MEDWLSQVGAHTGPRYIAIADAIESGVNREYAIYQKPLK